MKSNLKKILLTSTVFTCLNASFSLVFADATNSGNIETTATNGYLDHNTTHFVSIISTNPLFKAIQTQQKAHRDTLKADVALMLGAINNDAAITANLESLKNIITAALTADADAINDVEDKHDAKEVDTAASLLVKADTYQTEIAANSLKTSYEHYRLAYFLMKKIKPWLEKNYKNDQVEADSILKDQIPTHYPEWIDTAVLEKTETLTLEAGTAVAQASATVTFPVAKDATTLQNAKVYKSDGAYGTEVTVTGKTLAADGKSATITGLSDYGVYYVEVGVKKYYFTVENTAANEFIYAPDRIVKIESQPSDGLGKLATDDAKFIPKLSLYLGLNKVQEDSYTVSLDGGNSWKKLSAIDANDFLKSAKTLQFKGLGVGDYRFEVASPTPQCFSTATTSFKILPQIIKPSAIVADREFFANNKNATVTSHSPSDKVNFNSALFDTDTAEPNKLVTVYYGFNDTLSNKENYLLIPVSYTTASINAAQTADGGSGEGGGSVSTTPTLTYSELQVLYNHEQHSIYLTANGTVTNIPAGSYSVSIRADSFEAAETGTLVVNSNGSFYVSLYDLTFEASGETVTVQMTDSKYKKSFTFTTPVITPTFGDNGIATFLINSSVFDEQTPTVYPADANHVTGYSSISDVSSDTHQFTAQYTVDTLGQITPEGSIDLQGTSFTFAANEISLPTESFSVSYDSVNTPENIVIHDISNLLADGTDVTDVVVTATGDIDVPVTSNTNFDGYAFTITLAAGQDIRDGADITFKIDGNEYTATYTGLV